MSLILTGLIVAGAAGGALVGRWLAKRSAPEDADPRGATKKKDGDDEAADAGEGSASASATADGEDDAAKRDDAAKKDAAKKDAAKKDDAATPKAEKKRPRKIEGPSAHLEGFPCQLGDVIMRVTGEEAWLAGGLVLSEEVPVAALFVAPDAGHDCAIYARPKPREALYWLEPLDAGAILVGGEPPTSVEHRGIRFDRARRLPLRPKRIGVGAPDVGDALVLAEYSSAGAERLLVLKSTTGTTRAYRGLELEGSAYEVIASGKSTLDE